MKRAVIFLGLLVIIAPLWAENQPLPEIDLDPPIECWYNSDFPMLTAHLDPSTEIVNTRLYFRCSLYQDYYFVDLEAEAGAFTAVAPQAEETCPRVHYYVEAVTRDFTSARTPERIAEVTTTSECRRRYPAAAFFPGTDPRIVVGSTVAGPELAPGFKSIGVSAFMSATGVIAGASSSGGSTALVAGVAAAAGAAAGVGVLVANSSSSDPAPPPAGPVVPPPTVAPPVVGGGPPPPPPPPAVEEVKACVKFEPIDAVVDVNEPLTIDGRCSEGGAELTYRYDLGDGRIKEGQPFITVVYSDPGTYSLTLTVQRPDSSLVGALLAEEDTIRRTVRVKAPFVTPVPAFDAYNVEVDACHAEFNASATTGDVEQYLWDLDLGNVFGEGVIHLEGKIRRYFWRYCANGFTTARLTVVGKDGSRRSITKDVNVYRVIPFQAETSTLRTSLSNHLVADNDVRAQVLLGRGQAQPVAGGAPSVNSFTGVEGRNTVEGVLMTPLSSPALWRFDFSATAYFVPGSLRLVNGIEVSRDARSIVVRMTGRPGERVRLDYELRR